MAYNKKYYLPFKDFKNQSWELELAKEEYSGTSYKLIGTGDPVIMNDPNNGKGKFTPIKGSKLDMNFLVSPAIKEMFRQDFGNITDREWRAILKKTVGDSIFRGSVSIDTLDILNVSTDPTADVEITGQGPFTGANPYCPIEFSFNENMGDELWLYAKDISGNVPYTIRLATVNIAGLSDQQIIDAIITEYPKFSQEEPETSKDFRLKYTATSPSLYTPTWRIFIESETGLLEQIIYWFSSGQEEQWIEINLIVANELSSGSPYSFNIAKYYYDELRGLDYVANSITLQINNNPIFEDVYFSNADTYRDVKFKAEQLDPLNPNKITITIENIGEIGNIPIRNESEYTDGRPNDTFIEIRQINGGSFSWTKENFTGGASGGDNFTIEKNDGVNVQTISSTTAYEGDTIQSIIERLVESVKKNTSIFNAYVDIVDNSVMHIETSEDASMWSYKITTNGNSIVSPSVDTQFLEVGGTVNKWIGWIIPGIYKEQRTSGYINVGMTAIDGLGDLKNIPFDIRGARAFELKNLFEIIVYSLAKTGLNFDIYEAFDLYELNMSTNIAPLKQVYQETSRLNGKSCYEVLEEIMTIIKAELLQKDGHWELRPKNRLLDTFSYRTYSSYGVEKDLANKTFKIADVGGKIYPNILLNNNTEIEYADVYRGIQLKQSYGFVDQLLKFPAFSDINEFLNPENPNYLYPWQLLFNDVIQSSFLSKIYKSGDYLNLVSDYGQDNKFYLGQKFQIGDIQQGDTRDNQFELSVKYLGGKNDPNVAANFNIQLIATDGTISLWLNESEEFGYVWEATETSMLINCSENSGDQTFSLKFDYPETFSAQEAKAEIRIYQPFEKRIYLKSAEIKINAYAMTGVKNLSYHQENINELTYQIYEEEINLGDVPPLVNAKQLYKNALYWIDAEGNNHLTELWDTNPASPVNPKRLLDHLRHFYLSEYAKTPAGVAADRMGPPIILSADIYGTLELRDIIRVKTIDDKLFTLTGGQWNIKRCLVSGEWEQINLDTSGLTVIDEEKSFAESSSGKNSYTTISGSEETTPIDLSNYLTQDQINALILGKTGTFSGSSITNRQITIYHNLGYEPTFVVLLKSGKQLNPANFTFDTEQSTDHIIITLSVPFQLTDTFKYRIL